MYRLAHRRPREHEMWGCAGGPPSEMEVDDRRVIAEYSIRCAPWGSFRSAQERRRSYYRFEQAYWATMIHEYGHQYEDFKGRDQTKEMAELERRAKATTLPKDVDPASVTRKAFAHYCELRGAQELYPDHYRRMIVDSERRDAAKSDAHREALVLAVGLLKDRAGATRP